ncbi:MAG TPA: S66 peptidase family protein [Pseudonocardiaceae bacterium]|nr:S66 peptidase family protein [Pseudonocardiaceae bacterium]
MVNIRYPVPLQPGDRIAVTAPSCGVNSQLRPRLEFCLKHLRDLGYEVVVGHCMDGSGITSAPAPDRAAELTAMLIDPAIRAVVPPLGGELAIDLLPLLDFEAISAAQPTWMVGYSDLTTVMVPLTLRTGIATLHGSNLLDTPCAVPEPLLPWLAAATAPAGSTLWQGAAKAYRTGRHDHYAFHPQVRKTTCNTPGRWKLLGAPDNPTVRISATGRLIGGCLETISMLPGSSYGDVADFASRHAPEGLLVYVEVAEAEAVTAARMLHHLRLAGWFTHANAVLVGRSAGPPSGHFSQHDALIHALADLPVPVLYDLDLGHIPPQLAIINGALGTIELTPATATLVQHLN